MMTIRQAINKYNMAKANYLDKDLLYVIFNTSTCLIITMNNGVKIFLDIHPEMDYMEKEEFKLELPNKNGVFKRISFEILCNNVESLKIPLSMTNKITKSSCNGVAYYVDLAKEKVINEFISLNGGINLDDLQENINEMWNV